jgi:hypothetical protein
MSCQVPRHQHGVSALAPQALVTQRPAFEPPARPGALGYAKIQERVSEINQLKAQF